MEVSTSGIIPCKGRVRGHLVHRRTGEITQPFEINNVTTYAAADILARLLGGDTTYVPEYMGFIYGPGDSPTPFVDPPVSRTQTWEGLTSELADPGVGANVLVTPMATAPRYAVNGEADRYTGNMITLNANTASRFEYGFPTTGDYSDELADGDYFYHALLLVRRLVGTNIEYIPYARVSLSDDGGNFLQKPAGYELALYWDVTYY